MTYVNHVDIASLEAEPLKAVDVFTFLGQKSGNEWLPKPDQLVVNLSYPMPDERGRLHVQINPAMKASKDSRRYVMRFATDGSRQARGEYDRKRPQMARCRARVDCSWLCGYDESLLAFSLGEGIMTGTPTITTESVPLLRYRPEGATISEDDYRPIDPNFQLVPSRFMTHWLAEVLDEIDKLAQLPPGWDSNGAGPVEAEIVAAARRLIREIANPYVGIPRPTVLTATRSGGIQFEWGSHEDAYFELEILNRDNVQYFQCDPCSGTEKEGIVNIDDCARGR